MKQHTLSPEGVPSLFRWEACACNAHVICNDCHDCQKLPVRRLLPGRAELVSHSLAFLKFDAEKKGHGQVTLNVQEQPKSYVNIDYE